MGRIHAFLHRDADEFFEQLAKAELRFFARYPWRARGLSVLSVAVSVAVVWLVGGLRTALILFGISVVSFLVVTMLATVRMKRGR